MHDEISAETFKIKKTKLFGEEAKRITREELPILFEELKAKLPRFYFKMEMVRALPTKPDHGDVDILVLIPEGTDLRKLLDPFAGKLVKNGNIYSILYHCEALGRQIHVDFIYSTKAELHETRRVYYAYNDLAAIVGMVAKKLHFLFGSDGFFKRFKDKRGNYHSIFLTYDLMTGLKLMGFSEPEKLYETIQGHEDIVAFVAKNPLVDISWFEEENLNHYDRGAATRRPGVELILNKLRAMKIAPQIAEEDFYLRQHPELMAKVVQETKAIDEATYAKSVYGGEYLMQTFGMKPGPQIGKILKAITDKFGSALDQTPESEVREFVAVLIGETK